MKKLKQIFKKWAQTDEVLEDLPVMGHEVVDDGHPRPNALLVRLEEGRVNEEVKYFLLPRLACVLVGAEAGQQLGASTETRQVVQTASSSKRSIHASAFR